MLDRTCRECMQSFESVEFMCRHLRSHGVSLRDYVLKHAYCGIRPRCSCGCGAETAWNVALRDFAHHALGHHMTGAKRSEETKRKIGATNSIRMKQWLSDHPIEMKQRVEALRAGITSEVDERRVAKTREAYAQMTSEDKQKFSEHAKRQWTENRSSMIDGHRRATQVYKQRIAAGVYDFTARNEKLSERVSQMYVDGSFSWCRGHHVSPKTGLSHRYRSSWEKLLMEQMDTDDSVSDYRSEPFVITYELDGRKRRYVPDFIVCHVDGSCEVVEVKPESLRETAMNAAKRSAAIAFCKSMSWSFRDWSPS